MSVPRLAESTLIRYLKQIFKVPKLDKCHKVQTAIQMLREVDDLYLPEGLDEDCAIILERSNVRGNLWALREKSELSQIALANGEEACFLIPDLTLHGADSIFLCAMYVSETYEDMSANLSECVKSWARRGCPNIMMCGYEDKKYGGVVHIVAAQLKSLV